MGSSGDSDNEDKTVTQNKSLSTDTVEKSGIGDMKHDTVEDVETKQGSNDEVSFENVPGIFQNGGNTLSSSSESDRIEQVTGKEPGLICDEKIEPELSILYSSSGD